MEIAAAAAAAASASCGAGAIRQLNEGCYNNSRRRRKTMEIRWVSRRRKRQVVPSSESESSNKKKMMTNTKLIPIYISTNPSHIDPKDLIELRTTCKNHFSHCHPRLLLSPTPPNLDEHVYVDINKLRIALSHSSLLVSVFCNSQDVSLSAAPTEEEEEEGEGDEDDPPAPPPPPPLVGLGHLLQRMLPPPLPLLPAAAGASRSNAKLVGFGRAVSDLGLTASIYDVMVIPSLRRMGIGKIIVRKIIRMLTNLEIYDISALCSDNERSFFKACGFRDDMLGSTTMIYTKSVSTCEEGDRHQIVK